MSVETRFWAKVVKGDGCWIWQGAKNKRGYGSFKPAYKTPTVEAHLFAYRISVGPVPDGLELDHTCQEPSCVNPAHLEPVTHRENILRGKHPNAVAYRNGTCTRGHDASECYRRKATGRIAYCRACKREAKAALV